MGKATSTTVDTEQKQEEQEEEATKHKRVAGKPRKAGCAQCTVDPSSTSPAYPPLQRTGPLPRIDLFPLLRRPSRMAGCTSNGKREV